MSLLFPAFRLIGCIILCLAAGLAGTLISDTGNSDWYRQLAKPSFNPPAWIFAPVWTVLYVLMGMALFLMAQQWPRSRFAIAFFVTQLILNALWTPVFFGMHKPWGALLVIVLLWGTILATLLLARQFSLAAAWLLAPYLAWASFASVLNFAIAKLN